MVLTNYSMIKERRAYQLCIIDIFFIWNMNVGVPCLSYQIVLKDSNLMCKESNSKHHHWFSKKYLVGLDVKTTFLQTVLNEDITCSDNYSWRTVEAPHTGYWGSIVFGPKSRFPGTKMNIEFDVISSYFFNIVAKPSKAWLKYIGSYSFPRMDLSLFKWNVPDNEYFDAKLPMKRNVG